MAHQSLQLPLQQLYSSTTLSVQTNMPYSQLLSMHSSGEQIMSGFYNQNQSINDFGAPSTGSLDSGFDEVDPFDKRNHYHPSNNAVFDHSTMNQQGATPMAYDAFGYPSALAQRGSSDFSAYHTAEIANQFQPLLSQVDTYGHYQASSGLEDVSEDGRTASICSESPQQATFAIEASPHHKHQSSWSGQSEISKQQPIDNSATDTKCINEERVAPKAAPTRGRPRKRIPHTAVERRYRENLNAHLERLRAAVPNLTAAQRRKSSDGADPMKPSKCEVLMGAVDYIKRLELENDRLQRRLSG